MPSYRTNRLTLEDVNWWYCKRKSCSWLDYLYPLMFLLSLAGFICAAVALSFGSGQSSNNQALLNSVFALSIIIGVVQLLQSWLSRSSKNKSPTAYWLAVLFAAMVVLLNICAIAIRGDGLLLGTLVVDLIYCFLVFLAGLT